MIKSEGHNRAATHVQMHTGIYGLAIQNRWFTVLRRNRVLSSAVNRAELTDFGEPVSGCFRREPDPHNSFIHS